MFELDVWMCWQKGKVRQGKVKVCTLGAGEGTRGKLSTKELMLLNCGVGEDSCESPGQEAF